jgi:decaprenylphospho-beta-D-erythro-pentofuranosid-2-ulose 2-reductase
VSDRRPTAVIVGASAGLGRALALAFGSRGYDLILSARGLRDLEATCRDISVRHAVQAYPYVLDLAASEVDVANFYALCRDRLGGVDVLLTPAGYISPDDRGLPSQAVIETTVRVNYLNIVSLLTHFVQEFMVQGHGQVVGFSSVAAAVPRKRNMAYASAKAGLEAYLKALRHYCVGTDVIVQGYALGYIDTSLSFGRKLKLPVVSPDLIAARVLHNLGQDIGVVFLPAYWRFVVGALRKLPWPIYRRLSF